MSEEGPSGRSALSRVADQLRDPTKLRIATLALALASIGLVYSQMSDRLHLLEAKLKREWERATLLQQTQELRSVEAAMEARMPPEASPTFWAEYLIAGVREADLKLARLSPVEVKGKTVGLRQALEVQLEVQGTYRDVYRLVAWIEGGRWPARVTHLTLTSTKGAAPRAVVVVGVLVKGKAS